MNITREYTKGVDNPVLLVCDYYETSQIPQEMLTIKYNLALFPIANVPLIDLLLSNLQSQGLRDVIIAGSHIKEVVRHVSKTEYPKGMNIRFYVSTGRSLGDIFREFDQLDYQFDNLLVMYANMYTTVPLLSLIELHKAALHRLLSIYLHKNKSNDISRNIYAMVDRNIVYYDRVTNGRIDSREILDTVHQHRTISIDAGFSSPIVAVVSGRVFRLFTENFDYHTIGDFMTGILASKMNLDCFKMFTTADLSIRHRMSHSMGHFYTGRGDSSADSFYDEIFLPPPVYYNREIKTLLDYYNFNKDVWENPDIAPGRRPGLFCDPDHPQNDRFIFDSFVGYNTVIQACLYNCIVWDGCTVNTDRRESILVSDDCVFDIFHLEAVAIPYETPGDDPLSSEHRESDEDDSFFENLKTYLLELASTGKIHNVDLEDVHKQVSLLRIVWNATHKEVIEALGYFFVDILDPSNLEGSLSCASVFFDIFGFYINSTADEELFLDLILESLSSYSREDKTNTFFNCGYLLVQSNVIGKASLKKYSKMYKSGKL